MKTSHWFRPLTGVLAGVVWVLTTGSIQAQASDPAPPLSYGVADIVQMSQADVSDATIINYIQNAGSGYGLNASQIIYLKQQGVSDAVVNARLNQPSRAVSGQSAATVAETAPSSATTTCTTTVYTVPASTPPVYVMPAPSIYPCYSYPGDYPAYRPCWPVPVIGIGWGWRGGYYDGGHGFHGGWHR